MKGILTLLGRILICAIFLYSGYNKITGFEGTRSYMAAHGMPYTTVLLLGAMVFEICGGLSVLSGFKGRWGAFALIVFLVPATLIFHTDFGDQNQIHHFMKNTAIIGGLLLILAHGTGPLSLGVKKEKQSGGS